MANIIDTSFFVGDIEIPNVAQAPIRAKLENSIKLYEKEVLISLLGYPMWKDLQANIASPSGIWDKLINGEEFSFTFNGETITTYWEGLKGLEKKSLIAYYVYFMHRRKEASYMAGVGTEVKADTENSTMDDLHTKLVYVWNEFIKMYGDVCGDMDGFVSNPQHENMEPSAYNYILAKAADFTNWKFQPFGGEINRFGI